MARDTGAAVGQAWLRGSLGNDVPAAAVESRIVAGARRTVVREGRTIEFYPRAYAPEESVRGHLRFALRYEPLDMGVLAATMKAVDPEAIRQWVLGEPTGEYSRRAWFFHEMFTGRELDLPDADMGNYAAALNPDKQIVSRTRKSRRHRIDDNLLGGAGMCLTVRRTERLMDQMKQRLDLDAAALVDTCDPSVLNRALIYLYAKETRSSFAIEGEKPSERRTARFVAALMAAQAFDPASKQAFLDLQQEILDARYAATDWRNFQNFVGETVQGYREEVHFVCPRPQDVPDLMAGWTRMTRKLLAAAGTNGKLRPLFPARADPVVVAALAAFAFVFVHPFEDGNGRTHRFLMHHILAKTGYSPPGMVFPVSAAIVRDRPSYDTALESFSKPAMQYVDWVWTAAGNEIAVRNDTADLYRYYDATAIVEYLYQRVADTVRTDLKEELDFLAVFDRALAAVRNIVDMPDRKLSLFVRLCMQNAGRISASKRKAQFPELEDREVAEMQEAVRAAGQQVDD